MKKIPLYIQVVIISLLVFLADLLLSPASDASLLVGLLFWAAIGQGIIAMCAASDLSQGKWAAGIKPYMQQYYPLLLLFPIAFLIFSRHITAYPWTQAPNAWLSPTFFIVRNVVALLLPFIFAHIYVKGSQRNSPKIGLLSLLYVLSFLISQSFIGYDLIMTFEYPWINTLAGGFFFVEALYAGIAFGAILSGRLKAKDSNLKQAYKDFTLMIMGFSLFWAGLFYSQYLVIWYGNIPEEVGYIVKRVAIPWVANLGIFVLLAAFVVPFLALVSRKIKNSVTGVTVVACILFSGLIAERVIYLVPTAHVNYLGIFLPLIILGIPYIGLMLTQTKSVSQS